jgi:hypothetical protein
MSTNGQQQAGGAPGRIEAAGEAALKRPYHRPVLEALGSVVQHTLAPSPGTFESGQGAGFRGPGGASP